MSKNLDKWLSLKKIPNLGDAGIKKLYDHFGSADAILNADIWKLSQVEGINQKALQGLLENLNKSGMPGLQLRKGVTALTFDDPEYPRNLLNIHDPPSILYVKGGLLPRDEKAIAIVGTRKATHYGEEIAKRFACELAGLGITVVSGMALGVDTCAHQGALEAKGRTIAVLGCGVDVVYPPENEELAQKIPACGAIVSEFLPGEPEDHWKFPRRNRIISGLSHGTIVIEGGVTSGAMITARLALEEGREVFAVPGNILSETSRGPHRLIKQGAKLTESIDDVLDELTHLGITANRTVQTEKKDYSFLSPDEQAIIKHLSHDPRHVDEISRLSGIEISRTLTLLSQLEIRRIICQTPGKMFAI